MVIGEHEATNVLLRSKKATLQEVVNKVDAHELAISQLEQVLEGMNAHLKDTSDRPSSSLSPGKMRFIKSKRNSSSGGSGKNAAPPVSLKALAQLTNNIVDVLDK